MGLPKVHQSSTPLTETAIMRAWRAASVVYAGVGIAGLCVLVYFARSGFDTTDESYYFKWAAAPGDVALNPNIFGYALNPLLAASGYDIGIYRVAGMVLMFALGALFGLAASRLAITQERTHSMVVAILFGLCSLNVYTYWLPTPGYNWLAVFGCILAVIGLALWAGPQSPSLGQIAGAVLAIALAGFFAAVSRPATAAVLGLLVVAALFASWQDTRKTTYGVLLCLASCVVVTTIWLLPYASGSHYATVLQDGYSQFTFNQGLWRIPVQAAGLFHNVPGPLVFITSLLWVLFVGLCVVQFGFANLLTARILSAIQVAALLIAALALLPWGRPGGHQPAAGLFIGEKATVIGLAFTIAALSAALKTGSHQTRREFTIAVCLILLITPWTLALAGGNSLSSIARIGSGLELMAGLFAVVVLAPETRALWHLAAAACLIFTAQDVVGALQAPYRLAGSIPMQTEPVTIAGGRLFVDLETAQWLDSIKAAAQNEGFVPGTPLLDLTGRMPGLALIIGAKSLVHPWIYAGYPESQEALVVALQRMDQRALESSWLAVPKKAAFDQAALRARLPAGFAYKQTGSFTRPYDQLEFALFRPLRR